MDKNISIEIANLFRKCCELISIIIPIFNEEENIKKNLLYLEPTIRGISTSYEIIIVSDGSNDNSCKEAIDCSIENLKVFHYFKNGGKGKALKHGFQKSSGDTVIFMDADFDIHPYQLKKFIKQFKQSSSDVMIASKRHSLSKVNGPLKRKIMSRIFQLIVALLFRLPIEDSQVGLKAFKRQVLNDTFKKLLVKRYAFDLELVVAINELGYLIKEAPVQINYSYGNSKISFKEIIYMFRDTLAIFYRSKLKKYYTEGTQGKNHLKMSPRLALEDIPIENEPVINIDKNVFHNHKKRKILVAGGAGFIGSNLCEQLIKDNQIICIDNLSTGSLANIEHLMKNSYFTFIEHDITAPFNIDNIDLVVNLACMASPKDYQSYPIKTLLTSSLGTKNLIQIAIDNRCRFIFTSTSEIYGDPDIHPQSEDYWGHVNPVGKRSCYDEGKRFAESLTVNYARQFSLSTGIARIFNTYGPRMNANDGRAVPNFIDQALNNKNITIYGDGSQTRAFCYIDDMVKGLSSLIFGDIPGPINLGNPHEFTILDLAELVIKLTQSKSKIVFENLPEDDPTKRRPDISKAKKELNWKPKISLEDGLKRTIDFYSKEQSGKKTRAVA